MSLEGFIVEKPLLDDDITKNFKILIHESHGHVIYKYMVVHLSSPQTEKDSNNDLIPINPYLFSVTHLNGSDYRVTTTKKLKDKMKRDKIEGVCDVVPFRCTEQSEISSQIVTACIQNDEIVAVYHESHSTGRIYTLYLKDNRGTNRIDLSDIERQALVGETGEVDYYIYDEKKYVILWQPSTCGCGINHKKWKK